MMEWKATWCANMTGEVRAGENYGAQELGRKGQEGGPSLSKMPFSFGSLFRNTRGWMALFGMALFGMALPGMAVPTLTTMKMLLEECGEPTPTSEERRGLLGSGHSLGRQGLRDLLPPPLPCPHSTPTLALPHSRRDSCKSTAEKKQQPRLLSQDSCLR